MDNLVAMFTAAVDEFGTCVRAVADDQWDAPTPATEWSVADLVGHLVSEHRWAPPLMHGHDLDAATKIVDSEEAAHDVPSGPALAAEWAEVSRASASAFGEPGALERTVALSRGPTPASQYLVEMVFDLVVHSWDLGTAIGRSSPAPTDTVEFLYTQVKDMGDLSRTGVFDPPVPIPGDASTFDKLLAQTGRNPS
jgi:uncharacterized protein (TIGR03086 family)